MTSGPISSLFTYDALRDWLLPDLTKENVDKLLKIITLSKKTHKYTVSSIIQALAKLSLELPPKSNDLVIIQSYYIKFSFFNGNYSLITRLVGEGLDFQAYQFASKIILGEKMDLGLETSRLISLISESTNPIEISHTSFILIIILSFKGYFESAKNILYLCLDKMNILESEQRKLLKNPSMMLYQFSWLYLLMYTDPEGSIDLIDEIMDTIDHKIKIMDPIMDLLKIWIRLVLLDKTVIDDVRQVLEGHNNEYQFLIALIESQLYRNLLLYPHYFNFSLSNNQYPDFFSSIIKLDYSLTAWIAGKDQHILEELIAESIENSRKLYLYYPLIKGYLTYAMYIAIEAPKTQILEEPDNKSLKEVDVLLKIKNILFSMEEGKNNPNFLLFIKFLFSYLHWIQHGQIDTDIVIKKPDESENPLSFFYEIIQIISSTDYKDIAKKLRKLRKSTIYIISPAIQKFYTLLSIELKIKELNFPFDQEKLTRFQTFMNFIVSENHDLEEEDHIDYLLETFQSVKIYKENNKWQEKKEQLLDLLTLGEPFLVFKEIKEYFHSYQLKSFPTIPLLSSNNEKLFYWLHVMQIWSILNYLETSVPSYFLITPSWEALQTSRSNYFYESDLEDSDEFFSDSDYEDTDFDE
ncbi:MAG: hypothetical protein ACW967_00905 [Candidatus Hodarchaeales archaeon]|jgi:hypothetical protein